jgi:transaldolase
MGVSPVSQNRMRAVFLDRDGVLNQALVSDGKPGAPASLDQFSIVPEAVTCLHELKKKNFSLIVVTNQPDVARGNQSLANVEEMHRRLREALPIDEILVCYHDDAENCSCRKPRPGLLIDAQRLHGLDLSRSFLIGDRWKDVDAGNAAGCKTILIDYRYRERKPATEPTVRVTSLREAVKWIEQEERKTEEVMATSPSDFRVKLFADGADKATMLELYANPWIQGFTTNPTLMRKAGITDYEAFAHDILASIPDRPISLEVFADDFETMYQQAVQIASWGRNVYVKVPVTNTKGESALDVARELTHTGVKLNVTALLTLEQVEDAVEALAGGAPSYISVFAGRIADTGRDPAPVMAAAARLVHQHAGMELIWASPRELLNVIQADSLGCDILTATPEVLKKLNLLGKDLLEYSRETVQMFCDDARKSGFSLSARPETHPGPRRDVAVAAQGAA